MNLYGKIEPQFIRETHDNVKRIVLFDPTEIYNRLHINKYERYQMISLYDAFPDIPGYCACGCGVKLTGRRKRWASDQCGTFAFIVLQIIRGVTGQIQLTMENYLPWECLYCKSTDHLHVDHILPVSRGGGGSWLGNFQFLCRSCNCSKSNKVNHKAPQQEKTLQLF